MVQLLQNFNFFKSRKMILCPLLNHFQGTLQMQSFMFDFIDSAKSSFSQPPNNSIVLVKVTDSACDEVLAVDTQLGLHFKFTGS